MCATRPEVLNPARSQIPDFAPHSVPVMAVRAMQSLVDDLTAEARVARMQSQSGAATGSFDYARNLLTESLVLEQCAHRLQRLIDLSQF